MPYTPLPRITLADALSDDNPLFPDICPCAECSPVNAQEGPQSTAANKSSESTRAPRLAGARRDIAAGVLIERVSRKYGG